MDNPNKKCKDCRYVRELDNDAFADDLRCHAPEMYTGLPRNSQCIVERRENILDSCGPEAKHFEKVG